MEATSHSNGQPLTSPLRLKQGSKWKPDIKSSNNGKLLRDNSLVVPIPSGLLIHNQPHCKEQQRLRNPSHNLPPFPLCIFFSDTLHLSVSLYRYLVRLGSQSLPWKARRGLVCHCRRTSWTGQRRERQLRGIAEALVGSERWSRQALQDPATLVISLSSTFTRRSDSQPAAGRILTLVILLGKDCWSLGLKVLLKEAIPSPLVWVRRA